MPGLVQIRPEQISAVTDLAPEQWRLDHTNTSTAEHRGHHPCESGDTWTSTVCWVVAPCVKNRR